MNELIVIFLLELGLSEKAVVLVDELDLAFVGAFHHHSAEAGPHLLTPPIFGFVATGAGDGWNLEHVAWPFGHESHFNGIHF